MERAPQFISACLLLTTAVNARSLGPAATCACPLTSLLLFRGQDGRS
jgi:hypothetical protein